MNCSYSGSARSAVIVGARRQLAGQHVRADQCQAACLSAADRRWAECGITPATRTRPLLPAWGAHLPDGIGIHRWRRRAAPECCSAALPAGRRTSFVGWRFGHSRAEVFQASHTRQETQHGSRAASGCPVAGCIQRGIPEPCCQFHQRLVRLLAGNGQVGDVHAQVVDLLLEISRLRVRDPQALGDDHQVGVDRRVVVEHRGDAVVRDRLERGQSGVSKPDHIRCCSRVCSIRMRDSSPSQLISSSCSSDPCSYWMRFHRDNDAARSNSSGRCNSEAHVQRPSVSGV